MLHLVYIHPVGENMKVMMPAVHQRLLAQVSLPQMPSSALPHPALPIAPLLAFSLAATLQIPVATQKGQSLVLAPVHIEVYRDSEYGCPR